MSGFVNAVSCQPVVMTPEPVRRAYLVGRCVNQGVHVVTGGFAQPEEAWAVADQKKMHVLKVVEQDGVLKFETYLSNPDAIGAPVDVITYGLGTLVDVARLYFSAVSRKVSS